MRSGDLERLITLLTHKRRGAFTLALYDRLSVRREITAVLRQRLSQPVYEVYLSEQERNPIDLIRALKPKTGDVVCLCDIERAFPESLGYLDLQREVLADMEISLVCWVTTFEHRELARRAPNFYAFRTAVFDFTTPPPPKVFISYSHDSTAHEGRVLAFSDRLREDGIDCTIDQYEPAPAEGWPRWMERQILDADFVLVVCTETYPRRVEGKEEPDKGHGVLWESNIIYNLIYADGTKNEKFIPVLFKSSDSAHIPVPLQGYQYYRVDTDEGYEELYRRLTNQPLTPKAPLGKLRTLPPRERKSDVFAGQRSQSLKESVRPPTNLPPPYGFIGRRREVKELTKLLKKGGCVVLMGLGGVGKTALARKVAYEMRSHFVGGTVWVNGETKPPLGDILLTAAVALTGEVARQFRPDEQRQRVDDALRDRPCLLILDNFENIAEDGEVLRWLKTASAPSAALVVSRQSVPYLNAPTLKLTELPHKDAVKLFTQRARDAGWEGTDAEVVSRLCELVGKLPLAIELLAPRAAELPLTELEKMVSKSLDAITAEKAPALDERHRSIAACFRVSFDRLSEDARSLLTRLSVLPDGAGADLIAGFTGIEAWQQPIAECVRHSLLNLEGGRYRFHPLVWRFAGGQLGDTQKEWQRRFVDFYCKLAVDNSDINDPDKLAFLDAEWRNIIAAAEIAWKSKDWQVVITVAERLNAFLYLRGMWPEWERLTKRALAAARAADNRQVEGRALTRLGDAYRHQGRWAEAEVCYQQSLAIYQEVSAPQGEAHVLNSFGRVCEIQGRWAEAEECYQQSLAICRKVSNREGEGMAQRNVGRVYLLLGRRAEAKKEFQQCLAIQMDIGDRLGEAYTLTNLGECYRFEGQLGEAEKCHQLSLKILRERAKRNVEGEALNNLGNLRQIQGRWEEAEECYQKSLEIYRALKDRIGEGQTLNNLGTVYKVQKQWEEAEASYQQSLTVFQEFGYRVGEGQVLMNLALLREAQGDISGALEFGQQAIAVLETTEDTATLAEVRELVAKWEQQLSSQP